jgi:putative ABC transport system permease protein
MTLTYVLMQNLRRNRLRTVLTSVAFALPMAVFVLALSLVIGLQKLTAANEKQLRLGVHQKTSFTNLLPEGMRRKIESLDQDREPRRLRAVCGMRWFGGRVPNTPNTLHSIAVDVDTFPTVYSEISLTPDDLAGWHRERTAAIVGGSMAAQYGWKTGSRVVLESTIPPYISLEFQIVKIMKEKARASEFYFRRDYLNEALKSSGMPDPAVHIFWVKCNSVESLRSLQNEIDALFANTPDETKSEDENAFIAFFTQAIGDIPGLMKAMALVVVFIIALVAGNTMMMSFRERTGELAIFKAIGFQSWRVFAIVLAESVLLALVGSLAGIIPTCLVLTLVPLEKLTALPLLAVEVSPLAIVVSLLIAAIVGLAAGFWPAVQSLRLRTADALRRVA